MREEYHFLQDFIIINVSPLNHGIISRETIFYNIFGAFICLEPSHNHVMSKPTFVDMMDSMYDR